jgi:hypothetical protein
MTEPTSSDSAYTLYGGTPPHVSGSDTSRDAAERIKEHVGPIAQKIYRIIHAAGLHGCTVDELEAATGGKHQTVGPRVREMVQKRILRATDNRRLTRSKRYGTVYVTSGDDPRPSVKTKTDWKTIAESLFALLAETESMFDADGDMWFVAHAMCETAKKRHALMTIDADGNARPTRTP